MQPRLTRSPTESMISGVCGGLAEYFNIDPVIVRLIFILVTLTSGLGLPVYVVLWIVMPKAQVSANQQNFQQNFQQFSQEASRLGQEFGQEAARLGREVLRQGQNQGQSQARSGVSRGATQVPSPAEYRFDPITGQPLSPDNPSTGQTVNLNIPPADLPVSYGPPVQSRRTRNWSTLGVILMGIGGLIFLEQIGINMSLVFPAMLIFAGIFLLRRKR
ncbi:MAG: PspC domain-containing protein [Oscillochloris sp.]|nr:PspC domain-containing protein [Oscillochloris sp.]